MKTNELYWLVPCLMMTVAATGLGCSRTETGSVEPHVTEHEAAHARSHISKPRGTVWLASPLPFSSGVKVDAKLVFAIEVEPEVPRADVEASLRVISTVDGQRVEGAFSWADSPESSFGEQLITFTPSRPLASGAEYLVSVVPTGAFQPKEGLLAGGHRSATFTTGSLPGLQRVQMVSKDGGKTAAYARVWVTEPVAKTWVSQNLNVRAARGSPRWELMGPEVGQELQIVFTEPLPIDAGLTLQIDSAFRGRAAQLADVSQAKLEPARMQPCQDPGCWEWTPAVDEVASRR
jgi:hypothetical protein